MQENSFLALGPGACVLDDFGVRLENSDILSAQGAVFLSEVTGT